MKKHSTLFARFTIIFSLFFVLELKAQDNVGIGTITPDPTAILDLSADNKGLLIPRLTTAERLAIINPAHGLLVYDQDFRCFFYYRVPALPQPPGWVSMCSLSAQGATPAAITVTIQNGITAAGFTAGSTDTKGNITTTGTNIPPNNTQLTITFTNAYTVAPIVVVTPNNNAARTATYYVTSTATAYSLFINGGGADPSFNYMVIE
ncbi:MAG: hypothetical protein WC599_09105 [Bacteroidales bacterium]